MSFDDRNANLVLEQDICPHACRDLWGAVLLAQYRLAFASPCSESRPYEIDRARRWFGSRDFFMVCALAGVDGGLVLVGFQRKLEEREAA